MGTYPYIFLIRDGIWLRFAKKAQFSACAGSAALLTPREGMTREWRKILLPFPQKLPVY